LLLTAKVEMEENVPLREMNILQVYLKDLSNEEVFFAVYPPKQHCSQGILGYSK